MPTGQPQRGMTLIEVLAIVVIVGILATIALPAFHKTLELGHRREACDILETIYHAERAYFFTKNQGTKNAWRYYGPPLNTDSSQAAWGNIFMDNPNKGPTPVAFSVTAVPPTTGASAQVTAAASYQGKQMTVKMVGKNDVFWCGTANALAPNNMRGDSCDTAGFWPIP